MVDEAQKVCVALDRVGPIAQEQTAISCGGGIRDFPSSVAQHVKGAPTFGRYCPFKTLLQRQVKFTRVHHVHRLITVVVTSSMPLPTVSVTSYTPGSLYT